MLPPYRCFHDRRDLNSPLRRLSGAMNFRLKYRDFETQKVVVLH